MSDTTKHIEHIESVVVKFAGDSGDGMQLTGDQFSLNSVLAGLNIVTFPDIPTEIRAPQGTISGVSGFQIHFASKVIHTPGDEYDILVAMNAAAFKTNINQLKKQGVLIVNTDSFESKNLDLAGYSSNPLDHEKITSLYKLVPIPITQLTRAALESNTTLSMKMKDRARNMFVLGFLYWLNNRDIQTTIDYISIKFKKNPDIVESNIIALKAGYNYGDIMESVITRFYTPKATTLPKGKYRSISGNQATSIGLAIAAYKSGLPLFLGSYPITPATEILQELSKYKNFNVRTFQAEDEIAGICTAIGASYGGNIGVTSTSGPGIDLKTEAIGLAFMLELPLVICNVQRGGPSTGLPTKVEQSDLLQALYGRHGESSIPVLAAATPTDCFYMAYEAVRLAVEFMTPVFLLTDSYIANGAEPFRIPDIKELPNIVPPFKIKKEEGELQFYPYKRDNNDVRPWVIPGTINMEHTIGGLEKDMLSGKVNVSSDNHEKMVALRDKKVQNISNIIPMQQIEVGKGKGKILVLGWGNTYGVIDSTVEDLVQENYEVSHAHLRYINPLPKNLGGILNNFDIIFIPELNMGQLCKVLQSTFPQKKFISFPYIRGTYIPKNILKERILEVYNHK
ncbi:MAG: 2-oxoacid:acceptor oxidoreductase subunit alpha [Chitinophagaceae bacterium]